MFRKVKNVVEGDPKKSWNSMEAKKEVGWEEVGLVGIYRQEEGPTFVRIERRHQCSDQRFSRIRSPWQQGSMGGRPDDQIVTIKKAIDGRR